jgi:hypothetical protein
VVDWFATSEGAGDLSLELVVQDSHRPIPTPLQQSSRQGVLGRAHTLRKTKSGKKNPNFFSLRAQWGT